MQDLKRVMNRIRADVGSRFHTMLRKHLPSLANQLNANVEGRTRLHYAVLSRCSDLVSLLLHRGVDMNVMDKNGYSPLHYAVRNEDLEILDLLLGFGADVDIQEYHSNVASPLQMAVELGLENCVCTLLDHQANPFAENNRGESVMQSAVLLKKTKPEVSNDTYENILRQLLIHEAHRRSSFETFETVVQFGTVGAARLFLEYGVRLPPRDKTNRVLLLASFASNNPKMFKFILKAQLLDLNEPSNPILHAILPYWPLRYIKSLIKHGADVDLVNSNGDTPLHVAIAHRRTRAVRLLLGLGADVNVKSSDGCCIVGKALEARKLDIQMLIVRQAAKLEALGHVVEPDNVELIKKNLPIWKYYESCRAELALMRRTCVYESVSFFEILVSEKMVCYAINEDLVDAFKKCRVENYFPNYCDELRKNLYKEVESLAKGRENDFLFV